MGQLLLNSENKLSGLRKRISCRSIKIVNVLLPCKNRRTIKIVTSLQGQDSGERNFAPKSKNVSVVLLLD